MKNITVKDILRECQGKLIAGNEETICENFETDTRIIKEGDIFLGLKGENFDGNIFYETALEKGATVCILQGVEIPENIKEKYKDASIIIVEDTLDALQKIAKYKRSLYDIPVVAITGSVGKTSTKDIIANVIAKKFNVLKTQGNFNNHIGLPKTILNLRQHDALVVEMGMNHLGEIRKLSNIANPTLCVITNIGTSHIGELGSRENILKAKLEILEGAKENAPLIINNDNDMLNSWSKRAKIKNKIITFGIENKSDIMAENIQLNENGSTYTFVECDTVGAGCHPCPQNAEKILIQNDANVGADASVCPINVFVPIGGKHFVYNSLCAIAVGKYFNIETDKIIEGIKEFELTKRRMEVSKNSIGAIIINDAYNASYDSMKASIEYISKINGNKKIAVLGDMLELGKFEKELHEKVGEEVAKNKIDILITVGKAAKNIAKKAEELNMNSKNIFEYETKEEAINKIKEIMKKDDIVLIKASNGMKFDEIVKQII